MRIGVLAVQGAFAEHAFRLRRLGCEVVELRQSADLLRPLDGLVLPGGESTAQAKQLHDLGMMGSLKRLVEEGLPVLGTCAGLILLAKNVESASDGRTAAKAQECAMAVEGLGTMPVTVRRNGYGRQLGSFTARSVLEAGEPHFSTIPLTFIRAPRIVAMGPGVEVLAALKGEPVAVRFERQVGCCFHPELDADDALYRLAFAL